MTALDANLVMVISVLIISKINYSTLLPTTALNTTSLGRANFFSIAQFGFPLSRNATLYNLFREQGVEWQRWGQGSVFRKPRKHFGPVEPFLVHLYIKMEKCIGLKCLVCREPLFILSIHVYNSSIIKVPMKWNFWPLFYSRKLKSMLQWFTIFEFKLWSGAQNRDL